MNTTHPSTPSPARGAEKGAGHWWWQRITAVVLVPLTLWFVFAVLRHIYAGQQAAAAWIAQPAVAWALMVYLAAMFFHAQLGLQVIVEDYVSSQGARRTTLRVMKAVNLLAAAAAVLAVARIAFL